jgi:hypothetical protein
VTIFIALSRRFGAIHRAMLDNISEAEEDEILASIMQKTSNTGWRGAHDLPDHRDSEAWRELQGRLQFTPQEVFMLREIAAYGTLLHVTL